MYTVSVQRENTLMNIASVQMLKGRGVLGDDCFSRTDGRLQRRAAERMKILPKPAQPEPNRKSQKTFSHG